MNYKNEGSLKFGNDSLKIVWISISYLKNYQVTLEKELEKLDLDTEEQNFLSTQKILKEVQCFYNMTSVWLIMMMM